MGYIDLHIHTNASDGKWDVNQVINFCKESHVTTISLTEHYNLGSYKNARYLAGDQIEVIPGIEIGATLKDLDYSKNHVCHILAYYPNYNICKILDKYELSREKCVKKTIECLKRHINIHYKDVLKYARNKNSIGRFDIAIAISKLGYSNDPTTAYGDYLDTGKSYYVEREKMTTKTLIEEIRAVQGVPVLAHPKSLKMGYTELEKLLEKLKSYGLEGIEVYNPHHTPEQIEMFLELANNFSLIKTVGSDFHAKKDDNIVIGYGIDNNLMINDYSIIENLKERHSLLI